MPPRQRKTSNLSLKTRLHELETQNETFQDFLNDLMTLLEDYGYLEPEDQDDEEPQVIILNPEPAGIVEPKE